MKKILILLTIVLLLNFSSALTQKITYNQINDKLLIEEEIYSNNPIKIQLPNDFRSLESSKEYTIYENLLETSENNIKISYITNQGLDKSNEGFIFLKDIKILENSEINLILKLDKGYTLEKDHIFPKTYTLTTDGETIQINWNFTNQKQDIALFIKINKLENNNILWISLLIIISLILIIIIKKQNKKSKEYLLKSEQKIIEELEKSDNKQIWQRELQNKTEFSKAKLSRIIKNLESRNLIEKIPFGNTNKIKLK
jgi:uncharacterized membrane protein